MTLTKARLINNVVYNIKELSRSRSSKIVEKIFETLKENLESGNDVLIRGFGKFSVRENHERRGRHSSYENNLIPEAKRVVTFRCSPVLKEKINKGNI